MSKHSSGSSGWWEAARMTRYGRTTRDLRRTDRVSGWHQSKQTYKRERSGE